MQEETHFSQTTWYRRNCPASLSAGAPQSYPATPTETSRTYSLTSDHHLQQKVRRSENVIMGLNNILCWVVRKRFHCLSCPRNSCVNSLLLTLTSLTRK